MDWICSGVINVLVYLWVIVVKFDVLVVVVVDNLIMIGGLVDFVDMIVGIECGLLLIMLWYICEVDLIMLLFIGLICDGVYLVEDGEVSVVVNNFCFNESLLDLL